MAKIILNTNVISVKLRTLFQKVLYSRIPKRCFTVYISGKMNLQQNRIKNLFQERLDFWGKGKCELLGEQDHGTRIYGWFPVSRSTNY